MSLLLARHCFASTEKRELDFKRGNKSAVLRPDVVVVCLVLTTMCEWPFCRHILKRHLCNVKYSKIGFCKTPQHLQVKVS